MIIPIIDDNSHGMWRRVCIIEFPRKFTKDEMDVDLSDKLKRELPGIFNWALEGYKRLRSKNFKLTATSSMEKLKQQYKTDSDSVLSFASELLQKCDDCKIKFSDAYEHYQQYCASEGYKFPEKKYTFREILKRNGFKIDTSTKDGNQMYVFDVMLGGKK